MEKIEEIIVSYFKKKKSGKLWSRGFESVKYSPLRHALERRT